MYDTSLKESRVNVNEREKSNQIICKMATD